MPLLLRLLLGLLIATHFGVGYLEATWQEQDWFRESLGFTNLDQHEVAIVAKNQAFANVFLAVTLLCGWSVWRSRDDRCLLTLGLVGIAAAGVIGSLTVTFKPQAFLLAQFLPATAALILLLFIPRKAPS